MKKIIWIQKTSLVEIILCGIRSLFSEITVNYDERNISFTARYFLTWMKKFGLYKNFCSLLLSGDKKDSTGCTLFYNIYTDMEACIEQFNSEYISSEPVWFKRMVAAFLLNWASNPFYFVTMIKEEILNKKDLEHEVYIAGYPVVSREEVL